MHFLVSDENAIQQNRGVLEAFAVIIPEKYGHELTEVVPNQCIDPVLITTVLDSVMWRTNTSLGPHTQDIVKGGLASPQLFPRAMETLFSVSTKNGNPLNAYWMHNLLSSTPMPDRDAGLCPYLHRSYEKNGGLDRLVRWSLQADISKISSETAILWTIQLCWFCAASDRRVRDYATKGMVRIMQYHIEQWPEIIKLFSRVDDEGWLGDDG